MKVLTVIGARPQFIKAAAVSKALREHGGFDEVILHTGQHFDHRMSQVFFDELKIPMPKFHLDINSLSHGAMTGRMLEGIENILMDEKPDAVLVFGDTNSTLAGALAASKLHIPVAHVEAGLRSFNKRMPEEINRILTDHVSSLLFAPSSVAIDNLKTEGIPASKIHWTGDVMLDAVVLFKPVAIRKADVALPDGRFVLLTFHREENTSDDERIRAIVAAANEVAKEIPVVFPAHPRTKKRMESLSLPVSPDIRMIPPVGYLEMLALESKASLIVTDSGGVQKEAYFNNIPCVTIRTETEWVELVTSGWNKLVNPLDTAAIVQAVQSSIGKTGDPGPLYGDGQAGRAIANHLEKLQ